jgi:pantetheine-phosphate adenylyltransferase
MVKAIYAGCFDPLTFGHIDIIKRALSFCDELVIGVGVNPAKKTMFTEFERLKMMLVLNDILDEQQRMRWQGKPFFGLLVDFAKEEKANLLIRGIRSVSDFEYEINLSNINKTLAPNIETIFLPTSPELGVVSSSAVKEIAKYGGDISKFAPPYVVDQVKKQFGFIKHGNE